jgi:hypothetical protein
MGVHSKVFDSPADKIDENKWNRRDNLQGYYSFDVR